MTDTPEQIEFGIALAKWVKASQGKDGLAAVIRTYGDQRYQAAIDDVVEWINSGAGPYVEGYGAEIAAAITRRFGKG